MDGICCEPGGCENRKLEAELGRFVSRISLIIASGLNLAMV